MAEYKLPDVGEGLTEAEIVVWKVKVGDVIAINDIVVDIETAKSIVELPSPYAGTVTALLVAEGETVAVGTPIIAIGEPVSDDQASGQAPEMDLSNPAASGGVEGESLVGRNKADRGPVRRARKVPTGAVAAHMQTQAAFEPGAAPMVEAVEAVEAPTPSPAPTPDVAPAAVRTLAKPPVRKLAKDLGVDITTLTPTGRNGTVCREDVEAAASGVTADSEAAGVSRPLAGARGTSTTERETREPIKGVRKMMAQAMSQSAFTSPHVTEWITVDVTRTMELVERLKARRELRDVRVNPLLLLARATLLAVRRTPEINSWWDEASQEVVYKSYVNLGIAAATPRGLVVPNVKDADALSLVDLAAALGGLVDTARSGKTQPADMSGGTFTITNVGVFGVDAGTPIINPGESAILCFGAINKRPWVDEVTGEIVVRDVTTLALSFDHRHIDGEKGSRFLADVAGVLNDPGTALLY
ncbi:branched-chain alpha-keto acid dehydrogenase subunit E2 [Nocardioides sp. Root1257]|uniref:dihydrolipoamide acetyltransferase family protein n=1 Tax=unclassified Nocardioides TaxID=2615069 RepID=UPI0007005858|nr:MULTISPECIES: dihydrolipoamide acetyltransferase family protein [unclassified Nocardioides]KQW47849.1 branched-chain alpha-keto acid dehydrogenase subunit E2 [Nocardioides sp. Root1257]KRC45101.1 branched-chain alpha-keto acid dehydrogenase subunit E2 [Nocardioides sp. Root224]